jgi:uncharacterized protein (TIGR02996 family)
MQQKKDGDALMPLLACAPFLHSIGQGGHVPFLQACWDDPFNDVPRLVYADWLDEQGDCDRATFIRLQCAVDGTAIEQAHRRGQAHRLYWRHRAVWLRGIPEALWPTPMHALHQTEVRFEHGLLCGFNGTPGDLVQHAFLAERMPLMQWNASVVEIEDEVIPPPTDWHLHPVLQHLCSLILAAHGGAPDGCSLAVGGGGSHNGTTGIMAHGVGSSHADRGEGGTHGRVSRLANPRTNQN